MFDIAEGLGRAGEVNGELGIDTLGVRRPVKTVVVATKLLDVASGFSCLMEVAGIVGDEVVVTGSVPGSVLTLIGSVTLWVVACCCWSRSFCCCCCCC